MLGLALGLASSLQPTTGRADTGTTMRFVTDPDVFSVVTVSTASEASTALPAKTAATPAPATIPASWPVTLKDVAATRAAAKDPAYAVWPANEVKAARLKCRAILKSIHAVAIEEEPIKAGRCGSPAPIRLISFGRKPEVLVSPPALINCDMAEALYTWVTRELQPLARRHLGGPIVKIDKMSDYSCRNAYGRAKGRLSEHGRANALDIAGFTTAKGQATMLLADWGPTARQILQQIAAGKANAASGKDKKATQGVVRGTIIADGNEKPPQPSTGATAPNTSLGLDQSAGEASSPSSIIPGVSFSIGGHQQGSGDTSEGFLGRLGGPAPRLDASKTDSIVALAAARAGTENLETGKSRFLRAAHKSACRIFGTVLGPEANNAHRNHLHIDLAARKTGNFCE